VIRDLDTSLKALLSGEARPFSELDSATISVTAPDDSWRAAAGTGLHLSVYLCRIEENRELRSNEPRINVENGWATSEPPAARIDCTYLISAWNKGTPVAGTEQELQEHRLLSQALAVLVANPILPELYRIGALATQEIDPPLLSAQADVAIASPDFWSSFDTYSRPAISCRATIALTTSPAISGPAATRLELRIDGDSVYVLGGRVLDSSSPAVPVEGADVRVDETGEVAVSGRDGSFYLNRVPAGTYTLTVRAAGFRDGGGPQIVPSPTANYDVILQPL
jgi:hypothetical protein